MAKMTKDKFQNMNQLNRIEYFLYREKLKEDFGGSVTIYFLNKLFVILGIYLIIALLVYIEFENIVLLQGLPFLINVIIGLTIVSFCIDIVFFIISLNKSKKLDAHFLNRGKEKNGSN